MIEVVCGIIQNAEGHYLACRRPEGKHLGGLWEFPGGKIDAGETPAAALIRELREELGVEVEIGASLTPVEWRYEKSILLRPFLVRILSGELQAIEHDELIWCELADLKNRHWAPADEPILSELECIAAG